MTALPASRRILVTVGTDFHTFDRLVGWADGWSVANPDSHVVVQYGSSRAPKVAEGCAFFTPAELHEQMDLADIVVTHGGPATITEARRRQRVPVCVPRDPGLGEHVDDHQQRFARFVGDRGLVRLVQTEAEFVAALSDNSLLVHATDRALPDGALPEGVVRLGDIVSRLIKEHRAR